MEGIYMPKEIINTYSTYYFSVDGKQQPVKVEKIVSEEPKVADISKEITFGEKYSSKKALQCKTIYTSTWIAQKRIKTAYDLLQFEIFQLGRILRPFGKKRPEGKQAKPTYTTVCIHVTTKDFYGILRIQKQKKNALLIVLLNLCKIKSLLLSEFSIIANDKYTIISRGDMYGENQRKWVGKSCKNCF